MTKIETTITEIEHCGECTNADFDPTKNDEHRYKCHKTKRAILDLWGEIPSWCLLPDKEGK